MVIGISYGQFDEGKWQPVHDKDSSAFLTHFPMNFTTRFPVRVEPLRWARTFYPWPALL